MVLHLCLGKLETEIDIFIHVWLENLMSEWFDSQKKPKSNFRELLQERIEKSNPRRKLTTEETKRLAKLEAIAEKLRRGENVSSLI